MATAHFYHQEIGNLTIDTGIDNAAWGYGLNTVNFPTYGGEVVQILSVYIDDLTLTGTVSTYKQVEAIYGYFANYLQTATQGKNPNPNIGDAVNGSAYNLYPIYFTYPERNWYFKIYPQSAPGFRYGLDVVAPTWTMQAFVVDDSPDLDLIKNGILALVTKDIPGTGLGSEFKLNGEISPEYGNPDTDPFQTYTQPISDQQSLIHRYSDYYNSLIPAYAKGDFGSLTAAIGSVPNLGQTTQGSSTAAGTVTLPTPPGTAGNASAGVTSGVNPSGTPAHGGTHA